MTHSYFQKFCQNQWTLGQRYCRTSRQLDHTRIQRLPVLDLTKTQVLPVRGSTLVKSWTVRSAPTLVQRLPVQSICCILPGTSSFLNLAGRALALWGMWRSPSTRTNIVQTVDSSSKVQYFSYFSWLYFKTNSIRIIERSDVIAGGRA